MILCERRLVFFFFLLHFNIRQLNHILCGSNACLLIDLILCGLIMLYKVNYDRTD